MISFFQFLPICALYALYFKGGIMIQYFRLFLITSFFLFRLDLNLLKKGRSLHQINSIRLDYRYKENRAGNRITAGCCVFNGKFEATERIRFWVFSSSLICIYTNTVLWMKHIHVNNQFGDRWIKKLLPKTSDFFRNFSETWKWQTDEKSNFDLIYTSV